MGDELVINTDIDRLIDILSQRKRIEIDELERELSIEKKKLKKWLTVLEDEGYLKLEYRLTKIFAVWLLDLSDEGRIGLPHLKEEQIKKSAENAIETLNPAISESPFSPEPEVPEEKPRRAREEEPRPLRLNPSDNSGEADALREEIRGLEERKARIYGIEMPQLEKETEEKVRGITERMDSLNRHIASLQKSLKQAASEASGISAKSKNAKALVDEASEVYLGLTKMLTELKSGSAAKNRELRDEIALLQAQIAEDQGSINTMKESLSGIESMQRDLDRKTIAIRETVLSLNKALAHTADALSEMEERKDDFESRISKASKLVARKKAKLESLNKEVEGVGSLEERLDSYIKEYMKETDDIRLLVTRAESEIREIEENASQKAIEVYLGELERVANKTEEKMSDMGERGSKIDREIEERKARLKKLVGKARGRGKARAKKPRKRK